MSELEKTFNGITDAVIGLNQNWNITDINGRREELLVPKKGLGGESFWGPFEPTLGTTFEGIISRDDAGKKSGEFYTPREGVQLLVERVNPEPGDRVYAPRCGSGGLLIYSVHRVEQESGDRDTVLSTGLESSTALAVWWESLVVVGTG